MLLGFALITTTVTQAQSSWSLGIGFSSFANYSTFSGGMTDASALFHHNEFGSGAFNFTARKTLRPHWSFQTGLGFSSLGFNFALAQDYSMLNRSGQWTSTQTSVGIVNIPASLIYNSTVNCRNWRWFVGGGVSAVLSGGAKETSSTAYYPDLNTTVVLQQKLDAPGFATLNGHLIGGIEKVFKRQSILSFGLILNGGANTLMTTEVNYLANGKNYNHTFTNRGNFFGCFVAYHFRPLGSKRATVK